MLKKTFTLLFTLTTFTFGASDLPLNSVVKIHTAAAFGSYVNPWQTSRIQGSTGSGAILDNNLILTSAHVVNAAKFIEVTKENDPKKYIATLKHIYPEIAMEIYALIKELPDDECVGMVLEEFRNEVLKFGTL
ncbi:hypothetical protein [Sulfurimonas sp.]|uniref:hypothetical protein n=1 Tax=Sulfurimonas sp. TaxID=2022749 RepID=UPI003D0A4447